MPTLKSTAPRPITKEQYCAEVRRKIARMKLPNRPIDRLSKDYGVLINGRIYYQTNDHSHVRWFRDKFGGMVIEKEFSSSLRSQKLNKRDRKEKRLSNPLRDKLVLKQCAVLESIGLTTDGVLKNVGYADLTMPNSYISSLASSQGGPRTATDKEAATVRFDVYPSIEFDLRGSAEKVTSNSVAAIRERARLLLCIARAIELSGKKGLIPPSSVRGFVVIRDDKVESEIFPTYWDARKAGLSGGKDDFEIHTYFRDGTTMEYLDVVFMM